MTTAAPVAFVDTEESVIRVKSSSNPTSLAQAVANSVYEGRRPVLRSIGAGAVNQAIKACAIARGYVAPKGLDLTIRPGFQTVEIDEQEISAITMLVICDGAM